MTIKEREWRAPVDDTAKYVDVEFDNEPYNSGTEQLPNGNIETLNSTSWDNEGHSQQSFSGDCKVVWRNPNSNTNEKSYVGLSYNDYTSYTGISYYIFSRFYDTKYKYAYPFSGSLTSSVDIEVGDQAVIERKNGVIYMFIIRANGARVDIGNWTETSPGSAMKMAYTSYELGAILNLKFYKLEQPSFGYRFAFNGMEQDNEVSGDGSSYDFGARIYDSRLGRWMSTDPLQEEYPSLSPYNFVGNMPISAIDPDGRKIKIIGGFAFRVKVLTQLFLLGSISKSGREMIQYIAKSDDILRIYNPKDPNAPTGVTGSVRDTETGIRTVNMNWNDKTAGDDYKAENGTGTGMLENEKYLTMAHELSHVKNAFDENHGFMYYTPGSHWEKDEYGDDVFIGDQFSSDEFDAVHFENIVRAETGKQLRTHYSGVDVFQKQATKTKLGGTKPRSDNTNYQSYYRNNTIISVKEFRASLTYDIKQYSGESLGTTNDKNMGSDDRGAVIEISK